MEKEYARYLLKKTTEDYNLIADDFSRTRRYAWKNFQFLAQYVKAGDKVLDLGCGNGRLLDLFKNRKIIYIGVDNASNLIEIAKKRYPASDFRVADALNLPFPDAYFEGIYSIALLHHIPSQELRLAFFKEAKRVLKPAGILVLTVWNLWQWSGWKANFKYTAFKILGLSKLDFKDILVPWGKSHKRYFHCFSQRELEKLAKRAGLEVKEVGILQEPDGKGRNIYLVVKNPISNLNF
jgi:tRNA (uracil-5-)-methyltransferase TRM9